MQTITTSLLVSCLINGRALGDAIVMALPHHVGIRRKCKKSLYGVPAVGQHTITNQDLNICLPNLDISSTVDSCPYAQYIFPTSHAQDRTANFLAGFGKLIADDGKQKIFPVSIRYSLLQPHNPFSTPLVLLVLPDWTDAFPEYVVI